MATATAERSMAAFLKKNAVRYTAVEAVISDRFQDNGVPVPWKLKVLSQKEMDAITKACTRRIIDEKTGQERYETNREDLSRELLENCVIYPNLKDAALQDSYGVMGASALAEAMLLPGEFTKLINCIMQAQGVDSGMAKDIKTLKN